MFAQPRSTPPATCSRVRCRSAASPELARRLAEVPRGMRVVAYCRGPYCVLAAEAVRLLRKHGVDAVRLKDGLPEWRDAGLPIEAGASPKPRRAKEQR